jgi:hypothetical protein
LVAAIVVFFLSCIVVAWINSSCDNFLRV